MNVRKHLTSITTVAFITGAIFGSVGTTIGATTLGSSIFSDVQSGTYYDSAVGDLYSRGIITGYDSNTFGPNDYVTRGQVAVMMQRLINGGVTISSSSSSRRSSSSSSSSVATSNPKGFFRFTTTGFTVSESVDRVTVSIVRTGGTEGSATIDFATSDGTATAGQDYQALSSTVSFADGETSKTFTIGLTDDTDSEGSETFKVTLSNPTNGASLATPNEVEITLIDNESGGGSSSSAAGGSSSSNPNGALSFSANSYAINEDGGSITVTVQRVGGSTGTVGVNYATSNGTANSADYSSVNGTLSFANGETSKSFSIPIIDNSAVDANKTFNVTLSSPTSGGSLGNPSSAQVVIYDDEAISFGSGSLKFDKSSYEVTEGAGTVAVTVQRVGGAQGAVSVGYNTSNGTASAGSDYTAVSGTLNFASGEASKVINIPLMNDTNSETSEEFYIQLVNPSSSVQLINPYSSTITIYD